MRGMVDRFYRKARLADTDGISKYGYAFFRSLSFISFSDSSAKWFPSWSGSALPCC